MGIEKECHDVLHRMAATHKAYTTEPLTITQPAVIIDLLMHLWKIHPYGGPDAFTGAALAEAILAIVYRYWKTGASAVVLCIDINELVPKAKHGTQKKRDASTRRYAKHPSKGDGAGSEDVLEEKKGPYPRGTKLHQRGYYHEGMSEPRPINRQRLCQSRHMRPWLGVLLDSHLTYHSRGAFPAGCSLIIDSDPVGPVLYTGMGEAQILDMQHSFGEADLMIPMWARIFRDRDVYVDSGDGDVLILLMNYASRCILKRKLVLKQTWKDPKTDKRLYGHVDVVYLVNAMSAPDSPMSVFSFTLGAILCGTDFHDKSSLLSYIGNLSILEYMLKFSKAQFPALVKSTYSLNTVLGTDDQVKELCDWVDSKLYVTPYEPGAEGKGLPPLLPTPREDVITVFRNLIRAIEVHYSKERGWNPNRKKKTKASTPLPDGKAAPSFEDGLRTLAWNICYWGNDLSGLLAEAPIPLPRGTYWMDDAAAAADGDEIPIGDDDDDSAPTPSPPSSSSSSSSSFPSGLSLSDIAM